MMTSAAASGSGISSMSPLRSSMLLSDPRDSRPTGGRATADRRSALRLEDVAELELEHARGVDVGECGDGDRGRAGGDELAERRVRGAGVAIHGLAAAEVVAVVEEVEALQPEKKGAA